MGNGPTIEQWLQSVDVEVTSGSRLGRWSGSVLRCHARHFQADSSEGSLRYSGRFHRAPTVESTGPAWPALYTACSQAVALGEVIRNLNPSRVSKLSQYSFSKLQVELDRVLITHDANQESVDSLLGLDFARECESSDYQTTQEFASMAREVAEAILVPSCTRLPEGSLVIFPDHLESTSTIRVIETIDLSLVKWTIPDPPRE